MTKQPRFHVSLKRGRAFSTMLAVTAIVLAQYNPPTDPPPRRQTSFTGTSQAIARVPQLPFFVER